MGIVVIVFLEYEIGMHVIMIDYNCYRPIFYLSYMGLAVIYNW